MPTFGERLRTARKARGLSAGQLAGRVGKAESAVRNHENNWNGASLGLIETYARALNVTPGWLAFGEGAGQVPAQSPPSFDVYDCMAGSNGLAGAIRAMGP